MNTWLDDKLCKNCLNCSKKFYILLENITK